MAPLSDQNIPASHGNLHLHPDLPPPEEQCHCHFVNPVLHLSSQKPVSGVSVHCGTVLWIHNPTTLRTSTSHGDNNTPFATAPLLCVLALDWQLISAVRLLPCDTATLQQPLLAQCEALCPSSGPALPTYVHVCSSGRCHYPHPLVILSQQPRPLTTRRRRLYLSCPLLSYITSTLYLDLGIQNARSPPRRRTWRFDPSFNG